MKIFRETYGKYGNVVSLVSGGIKLSVTTDIGPRIIFYGREGGENILFEDKNDEVNKPEELMDPLLKGKGGWHIYGGHRLWKSPEYMDTYYPDNFPVKVEEREDGAVFTSDVELTTGLEKSVRVSMDEKGVVTLEHKFVNRGKEETTPIAMWALTVMDGGAEAHLPLDTSDTAFLPNRNVVHWCYNKVDDPRLCVADDDITIKFDKAQPRPLKVGTMNTLGYVYAYTKAGKFTIKLPAPDGGVYPDFSCNVEKRSLPSLRSNRERAARIRRFGAWNEKTPARRACFDSIAACRRLRVGLRFFEHRSRHLLFLQRGSVRRGGQGAFRPL